MSYAERLVAIDKGLGYIFTSEALLHYEPFNELASEGAKNIDNCIQFLATEGYSPELRSMAILSMHNLSLLDYIEFLRGVARLHDRHLVSTHELSVAITPGTFSFGMLLIENYDRREVREVLDEIAARSDVPSTIKSKINNILSGKESEAIKSFKLECCTPKK